jgi:hypothetical protein
VLSSSYLQASLVRVTCRKSYSSLTPFSSPPSSNLHRKINQKKNCSAILNRKKQNKKDLRSGNVVAMSRAVHTECVRPIYDKPVSLLAADFVVTVFWQRTLPGDWQHKSFFPFSFLFPAF